MNRFKHKPIEVEAICYTGHNRKEIETMSQGEFKVDRMGDEVLILPNMYTSQRISPGDYVVVELPRVDMCGVVSKQDFEKYWAAV